MEKISAACAMEWSIELEKALRSKTRGRGVEAITQTGPRLEQWSRESEPTIAIYNMFGLIPGEDKLFANTILLRLADAFQFGDLHVRLAVVKLFLSELRQRKKMKRSKRLQGILSKGRLHNHLELLTRVKTVYDNGDVESRVMALVLFGCWAEFAVDCAQIRYLILSSLISARALEVKASLFAAGCFSELADDFASVLMEMLVTMLTSPETMSTIKLSGVRAFAKLTCTHSVIYTAYKKGLKLVSESLEEDLLIALLVSLSKIASKLTLLASEQIDLLLLFLAQGKTSRIEAVALRCLHFIVIKGMCYSPASVHVVKTLTSMLVKPELPLVMQFEALEILQKILSYKLCPVDISEFAQLLTIVEKAPQFPTMSKNPRAIHALASVAIKILETREIRHGEVSSSPLLLQMTTLIIDGISFLGQSTINLCQNHFRVFQEVQSLLSLLLVVIGEHLDLGLLVLDKISLLLENIVNTQSRTVANRQPAALIHQMKEKGEVGSIIRSKLVLYINRFLVIYLETLNVAGATTSKVFDKVKLVVERVRRCDSYAELIYSMLLHSPVIWTITVNEERKTCNFDETWATSLLNYSSEHEIFTLECAKKMLTEENYWLAYRAGIHAAEQGGWVTAAFIFGQLRTKVQSDSCSCWLKSLAQFTLSEGEIQLLLLPKGSSILVDWLETNQSPETPFQDVAANEGNYGKVLLGAYHHSCSSKDILKSIDTSLTRFFFQIRFLAVRTKVIGSIIDLLKVLDMYNPSNLRNSGHLERSKSIQCNSLQQMTQISVRLKTLAQDLDLIATSFIDMDKNSLKIIAAFALSCSVLAFSTGFALFIPKLHTVQNSSESSQNNLQSLLIQNLVGRLWQIDPEISERLYQLLPAHGQPKSCFHVRSRNQILSIGGEVRNVLALCNYAVSGIVRLQNEGSGVHAEDILSSITKDGLNLMMDIIMAWIHIPFQVPKRFFKVRPCIGSEFYAFNADTRNPLSVISGFHLSLNLCLQLRNVPLEISSKVTKLYCILYSKPSFRVSREDGQNEESWSAWEDDEIVEVNEKLFHYVTEPEKKRTDGSNENGVVYAYVCFESNERGQGFSSSVLDVSSFPVGSYQIKWQSCCVDRQSSYWTLLSLNSGPLFSVHK